MPAIIVLASLDRDPAGQTAVVQFFGRYIGTVRRAGLVLAAAAVDPPAPCRVRVRNFETNRLKVNDADGNPVEIAAIVVWQVADTAKAMFAVENDDDFVDGAGRGRAAARRPQPPLRRAGRARVPARARPTWSAPSSPTRSPSGSSIAGVEILEVRISHLAYAPEIAQAMLQRQQAAAVVAARTRIVEGAVGMVALALDRLSDRASSSSTRNARPRWCRTCSSCSAATPGPPPS